MYWCHDFKARFRLLLHCATVIDSRFKNYREYREWTDITRDCARFLTDACRADLEVRYSSSEWSCEPCNRPVCSDSLFKCLGGGQISPPPVR